MMLKFGTNITKIRLHAVFYISALVALLATFATLLANLNTIAEFFSVWKYEKLAVSINLSSLGVLVPGESYQLTIRLEKSGKDPARACKLDASVDGFQVTVHGLSYREIFSVPGGTIVQDVVVSLAVPDTVIFRDGRGRLFVICDNVASESFELLLPDVRRNHG